MPLSVGSASISFRPETVLDRIRFQGQLEAERGGVFQSERLHDHDAIIHSLRRPSESKLLMRHFLITWTTQNPFDFLPSQHAMQSSRNFLEDDYQKITSVSSIILYSQHGSVFSQKKMPFLRKVFRSLSPTRGITWSSKNPSKNKLILPCSSLIYWICLGISERN